MKILLTSLFSILLLAGKAQIPPDTSSVKVHADPAINDLLAKHIQVNDEKEIKGYRIKIHFGIDKAKAKDTKSKFLGKFPDIKAYEDYQVPNFTIKVGDYRTRFEAYRALKQIQPEFPNAFIVADEIKVEKVHPERKEEKENKEEEK